ncbi:hypothetical protein KIPB_007470 [Kipferlia bialata]|uniref:Ubiquitin-like domain-containing protein n=1 Tax=Kipferlia bialata TaxID=797122 RepID=A0A9K3D0X9_9EUKA|nr:hypothetical protein KIPB_007470 [Kipferlia bialata]|eukprot:g7470.t1
MYVPCAPVQSDVTSDRQVALRVSPKGIFPRGLKTCRDQTVLQLSERVATVRECPPELVTLRVGTRFLSDVSITIGDMQDQGWLLDSQLHTDIVQRTLKAEVAELCASHAVQSTLLKGLRDWNLDSAGRELVVSLLDTLPTCTVLLKRARRFCSAIMPDTQAQALRHFLPSADIVTLQYKLDTLRYHTGTWPVIKRDPCLKFLIIKAGIAGIHSLQVDETEGDTLPTLQEEETGRETLPAASVSESEDKVTVAARKSVLETLVSILGDGLVNCYDSIVPESSDLVKDASEDTKDNEDESAFNAGDNWMQPDTESVVVGCLQTIARLSVSLPGGPAIELNARGKVLSHLLLSSPDPMVTLLDPSSSCRPALAESLSLDRACQEQTCNRAIEMLLTWLSDASLSPALRLGVTALLQAVDSVLGEQLGATEHTPLMHLKGTH